MLWLVGLFANPKLKSTLASQSPELSPVNILPVLLPPCAAGANPIINSLALISPKLGRGFPQYFSSKNLLVFFIDIWCMYWESLGHFLHLVIFLFNKLN